MRILSVIAAIAFASPIFAQDAPKEPATPTLNVPAVKVAPKIDGALDDAAWKEAAQAQDFRLTNGDAPKGKTRLLVAHDDKNLYVAVECFEDAEALGKLTAKRTEHDSPLLYEDDDVELFIDPTNDRVDYYQIIVNSKNTRFEGYSQQPGMPSSAWDPEMQSATKVGTASWTVEFAIPFSSLTMTAEVQPTWAFNVLRNRTAAGEVVYWSPVLTGWAHQPARFGTLEGMPKVNPIGVTPGPAPKPREVPKPPPPETLVLDFEDPADAQAWTPVKLPEVPKGDPAARVEVAKEGATHGQRALKITFAGGEWPAVGTTKLALPENVFEFNTLKLDVTAPRACLVALRILQEKSQDGLGWSAAVTRWNSELSLAPGKNEIMRSLPGRGDWEAINPALGTITTLVVAMYHPRPGESICIDNVRLSSEKPWPKLTTFKVLGTDLAVSGVEELKIKLTRDWKQPEEKTADALDAEVRAQYDELKKTHPRAVLAVLREGEAGYNPAAAALVYAGWAEAHVNSHSPGGVAPGRLENSGEWRNIEAFMRHRSALMRVDTSSIPNGSDVLAARLVIQGIDYSKSADKGERESADTSKPNMWVAEACNRPWVELEVNAYEYAKDKFWTATGGMSWGPDEQGDFLPLFLAHGPAQGPVSWWDFAEAVKFWTDGVHPNNGFFLYGTGVPYMQMFTKEQKNPKLRPALYVIYEPK